MTFLSIFVGHSSILRIIHVHIEPVRMCPVKSRMSMRILCKFVATMCEIFLGTCHHQLSIRKICLLQDAPEKTPRKFLAVYLVYDSNFHAQSILPMTVQLVLNDIEI